MNGVPVARIFGIEIRVQIGWVIVLGLIGYIAVTELVTIQPGLDQIVGWVLGGLIAVGFLASSAVHDLAHALVSRRRGLPVSALTITFFGGSTPLDPAAATAGDDLVIAAAGPIASVALGLVFAALAGILGTAAGDATGGALGIAAESIAVLAVLNLIIGVVNLVPAYPLDGGRILRAIAWRRQGSLKAGWRASARSGRIVGFLVIGIGIAVLLNDAFTNGAMIALTGWFLILTARSVAERAFVDELIGGLHVEDAMEVGATSVSPALTVDTFAGQLLDTESTLTAVPVMSDDQVVGVLGVREVRRLQRNRWPTTRVEEVMAKPPKLVILSARDSLSMAVERLQRAGLDGFPVVDRGKLVGMLTRRSVGQLLQERGLLTQESRTVG
jgi:Zn-dependent protease/CBS domain-containing protein